MSADRQSAAASPQTSRSRTQIVVRPPSPALAPFVACFWHFRGELPHARERILPDGTMQLLVNLHEDELRSYHGGGEGRDAILQRRRGAALCGAHARAFGIDTAEQREIVGVSFRPGGARPFFAASAEATAGLHVELADLWGRDGAGLRARLLEAKTPAGILGALEDCLRARAVRPLVRDPFVTHAVAALESDVPVGVIVQRLGSSARRFIRDFRAAVGLSPKRFARVRRFRRVLASLEVGRTVDWAGVALACGYFDQAHLIHDFREFSGASPSAYRARAPGDRSHVPL